MDTDINHIIQESINGDKFFQEILLKKLNPLIYKCIYRYYPINESIIEDLVQEGYIIILLSLKSFDKNRNVHFLRYVQIKLQFFYKNYYRNTRHQRETNSIHEYEDFLWDEKISLEDKIADEAEISELMKNIDKLPEKEKDVLNLYYNYEYSMEEIARSLNIAYRTAIGRKYTAVCRLRKMML